MTVNRTQPSLSRDFAMLSLLILFILVGVAIGVIVETSNKYERDVFKQMESEALRLDRALIVEIENTSYILESVGRQIQATGDDPENIAQLYFSFAKSEGAKRTIFSWINKAQMITVSNNLGVLEIPIDVSDRDYVKKSIAEPWKVHIGRPIDGRLSNKWVLPLSLGITDKNGTYFGSVVVALDANTLSEDIGRTMKDSGIRFALTNLALTLLTQSGPTEKFFSENFDVAALSRINFDETKSAIYSRASLFNSQRIYSYYERSSQYPYIIFLGMDADASRNAIYRLLAPRLFQLCVIAGFLLFVLWTVRKRIIQPVIMLADQTAAVLRGIPFDAEQTKGPLEIEQLSNEIKRLYDYIEERLRVESELHLKKNELTRIKEAAQMTNQVKADFFAYVGQELTDPVEVILAHSETVKDQHFGPIGNSKYLATANDIYDHAQQLLAMLADIKAISKAETGLLALNESDVDLAFVLQKSIRIFRDKTQNNIEVQSDLSQDTIQLQGDDLRMKQLVLSILNAASHQVSSGETIRIHCSIKAQEVTLSFSYAITTTASSATRSKHGLDIALARLLVAMHQGTLEMKTTPDRVTTILIKFPAIRTL
jgi:signal transduction histidine kinase